ncbi:MAG: uncharacterized protein PWP60_783 [Candidatus Atribacteria bacterium]|jgi:hypothetical protein|uniref:Cyclophilin-like fold protein n=1 Tax=Thermatribacter velox TaxID=3039681 RepID=A0ABZ2YAW1_9BACT|nr:uncharacterized protein [Candidatus Atribacteria bacterium]MDI3530934.1 uncharacterized protein [Candidatus Atribacteria bacterium]
MKKILFEFPDQGIRIEAELLQSKLAEKLTGILPYETRVNTWGEEIYFAIPLKSDIEKPQETVAKGDVAYWPEGACLCLFFGPTPISSGEEIRPASAVEVVGKISSGYEALKKVVSGSKVSISLIQD